MSQSKINHFSPHKNLLLIFCAHSASVIILIIVLCSRIFVVFIPPSFSISHVFVQLSVLCEWSQLICGFLILKNLPCSSMLQKQNPNSLNDLWDFVYKFILACSVLQLMLLSISLIFYVLRICSANSLSYIDVQHTVFFSYEYLFLPLSFHLDQLSTWKELYVLYLYHLSIMTNTNNTY